MVKYTDFFSLIGSDNVNPVAGLFMTYGFDAELFEKHILPNFLGVLGNPEDSELRFRNQIATRLKEVPVTVMSDARQYGGGQTFLYEHTSIKEQIFHPKCYILLYPDYLRVIIGSCNITKAGLCYNAETVWYQDIHIFESSGMTKSLKMILEWMIEKYGMAGNDSIHEITKFLLQCGDDDTFPQLISTINDHSAFYQYFSKMALVREKCKRINIISPFFESDRESAMEHTLLVEFADSFFLNNPDATMRIFFPAIKKETGKGYKVTAPVNILHELSNKYKNVELFVINREWEREEDDPVLRTLHAKLIIAEFSDGQKLTMSGSINFTINAMRSYFQSLRNIEISVIELGKSRLMLPNASRTYIELLEYDDKKINSIPIEIFIKQVIYDSGKLILRFDTEKASIPFRIEYQEVGIYETEKCPEETVIISDFRIKRSLDIKVICAEYEFYYPIYVANKEVFISDDLKLTYQIEMGDIIDYLAGKYKSVSEIERLKRIKTENGVVEVNGISVYFRHNLQRYYKALGAIKMGLEAPFYSEQAFRSYLYGPVGLKALVKFIVDDYQSGIAANSATFVFVVEIENIICHLHFQEDRLEQEYKKNMLKNILSEAVAIRKIIYSNASKTMKNQYDILLVEYGLEVRK